MARIRNAAASKRRKKRVLKFTKGQFGHKKSRFRQAIRSMIKGMRYAYRDRKVKKREIKSLWIIRINAACREAGVPYSRFMHGLSEAKVEINRKMLAELAVSSPEAFKKLVTLTQNGAAAPKPKAAKKVKAKAAA